MGRSKKKEGEKLDKSINIKVDNETHSDLSRISKSLGLSVSDIVRINIIKKRKEVIKNGEWHPENFIK